LGGSGAKSARECRNAQLDFHAEKRSNATPTPILKLVFTARAKGDGLVVDACLTRADSHGQRHAALIIIEPPSGPAHRITPREP